MTVAAYRAEILSSSSPVGAPCHPDVLGGVRLRAREARGFHKPQSPPAGLATVEDTSTDLPKLVGRARLAWNGFLVVSAQAVAAWEARAPVTWGAVKTRLAAAGITLLTG